MLYQLSYSPKYLGTLAKRFDRYSSTVLDGSGRVPQFKTYGKCHAPRTPTRCENLGGSPRSGHRRSSAGPRIASERRSGRREDRRGARFVRVTRLVVLALMWIGACGSQPANVAGGGTAAPATAPAAPAKSPRRQPAATLFGGVVDGTFKRQSRFELEEGTSYGWRIKLPCTGPTLFRETLQLPAPATWGDDAARSQDVKLSDDRRRAVVEDYSGCYDGWIQHTWEILADDPPGEYVFTVEVEGYQPQIFRGRFVRP